MENYATSFVCFLWLRCFIKVLTVTILFGLGGCASISMLAKVAPEKNYDSGREATLTSISVSENDERLLIMTEYVDCGFSLDEDELDLAVRALHSGKIPTSVTLHRTMWRNCSAEIILKSRLDPAATGAFRGLPRTLYVDGKANSSGDWTPLPLSFPVEENQQVLIYHETIASLAKRGSLNTLGFVAGAGVDYVIISSTLSPSQKLLAEFWATMNIMCFPDYRGILC